MLFRIADEHAVATAPAPGEPDRFAATEDERVLDLGGVVLLAGSVRPSPLRKACGRFFLQLPIAPDQCVMDLWHEHLTEAARRFDAQRLPVRVIVDRNTALPTRNPWNGRCATRFEQDPIDYRGTGGLLRDIARDYDPDQYLLVINAAQVLFDPLADIAEALVNLEADIAIACRDDGSPRGVMLVRCGCLKSISSVGFVDLNEQALPALAKTHDVRVLRGTHRCGQPIRSLDQYLEAVRQHHRRRVGLDEIRGPFEESWQQGFAIAEKGARVAPDALLHDSVVLAGGRVEEGAVIVRSLVGPGAVVSAGEVVTDRMVPPASGRVGGTEEIGATGGAAGGEDA